MAGVREEKEETGFRRTGLGPPVKPVWRLAVPFVPLWLLAPCLKLYPL